jgi:L-asparaginase
VPGVDKIARLSAEQISNIGSQDMNDESWFALAKRINEIFAKGDAAGVVITHGTTPWRRPRSSRAGHHQ